MDEAYGYAQRLATSLWEDYYKDAAPDWKPLDTTLGVLTQIDNMVAGILKLNASLRPVWKRAGGLDGPIPERS